MAQRLMSIKVSTVLMDDGTMQSGAAISVSNSGAFGGSQTSDIGATISGGLWRFPTTTTHNVVVLYPVESPSCKHEYECVR